MKNIFLILLFLIFTLHSPAFCYDSESAAILYNEAIDLYKEDNVEKSIELFMKAIEIDPDLYEAHYNLAQILMSQNKNDEALKPLEEIYRLKPEDSENLYNLGKIQYKRGYLSKSHEYLSLISEDAAQYESAKIILQKIEKRQNELDLEEKIKTRNNQVDAQGKAIGTILSEFSAPSGVAVDSRGNIFIASFLENRIYKISIYGQTTIVSKSALIKGPIGLAIDKNDNIYIANYSVNNIIKLSASNYQASVFADIQKPYCLIYDYKNNRLYATEQDSNNLVKFDL